MRTSRPALLLGAVVFSACTATATTTPSAPAPSPTVTVPSVAAASFTPVAAPQRFDSAKPVALRTDLSTKLTSEGVVLGDRLTLSGTTVYGIARNGDLTKTTLALGDPSWRVSLPGTDTKQPASGTAPWGTNQGPSAPVLAPETNTVYGAVGVTIWGPRNTLGITVVAVDSVSGRERWRVTVPLKQAVNDPISEAVQLSLTSNGLLAVIREQSVLLDPGTGATRWQIDGSVALGNGRMGLWAAPNIPNKPAFVFDAATGKRTDTVAVPIMSYAPLWLGDVDGVGIFQVISGTPVMVNLDVAAGTVKSAHADVSFQGCRPLPKGTQRTICGGGRWLWGVDVTQPKPLWLIDGTQRKTPMAATVFADRVYGTVTGKGVVLDLATGAEITADSGAPVFRVNEFGGLVASDKDVTFVRAAG